VTGAVDILVVIARRGVDDSTAETEASVARQAGVVTEVLTPASENAEVTETMRAVNASGAEFVTFMTAGDVLLEDDALATLRDAMGGDTEMVHAVALHLDREGRLTRDSARMQSEEKHWSYPDVTHGAPLATVGRTVNALPTFRRADLSPVRFSGASIEGAVLSAATAAIARGKTRVIASPLLVSRKRDVPAGAKEVAQSGAFRLSRYERLSAFLRSWPLRGLRARQRSLGPNEHVAYVLWRYPTVVDHVIRREVHAIRALGVHASVFAVEPDDPPLAEDEHSPAGDTTYFGKVSLYDCKQLLFRALLRRPFAVLRVLLLLIRHPQRGRKVWSADREVLLGAAKQAVMFEGKGVTHVHSPWANRQGFQALLAAKVLGLSYSVEARASEVRRHIEAPLLGDRLRFANFVITNSRYNEEFLQPFIAPARVPVTVVYEGIDPSAVTGQVKRTPDEKTRIVSVARLVEPKGFRHLLRACDRLRTSGVAFHLDIIGGAESFDSATWVLLRKLHTELKLEGYVKFWGSQPFAVVKSAMQNADLFVLPCVAARDGSHDITPNSLLEAMAMSLPVISTRSGAIPEIVEDGVSGLLVPPGDEAALANAMSTLISDVTLRSRLGEAARATIVERFDIVRNAATHARLFGASGSSQSAHNRR
jgi:glycosyltransferase involved in cell wall biosynthesis